METQKSNSTSANTIPEFTEDEKTILKEIQKKFRDASDFRFDRVGNKFEEGNTYMVEFTTKELKKGLSWYYAYVDKTGCQLFTEGEAAITHMQTLLDQKRSFMQRVKDFDFLDIIGALIALPITITFVVIVIRSNGAENAISKEFLTIVSLILGYYFGRNKTK